MSKILTAELNIVNQTLEVLFWPLGVWFSLSSLKIKGILSNLRKLLNECKIIKVGEFKCGNVPSSNM